MTTHTFPWQSRATALHASSGFAIWRAILVAMLIAGMLVAFHAVVSGANRAGEVRRQSYAALASAMRDCKALPGPAINRCMKDLIARAAMPEASQFAQTIQSASAQDE